MPTPPAAIELVEDQSVDPIRHDGDVRFRGSIRAGRVVEVGGCLTVDGDVLATRFAVGRTMIVTGIIREGRACTVGGDLRCGAIVDTNVVVRGDVRVQTQISGGRVTCAGRLDAPDAAIVGSDVSANGGVECRTLGDAAGTPTFVESGVGRVLRLLESSITRQIDERRQREDVMRASIEPLLSNTKSLSAAQREKTTEMLFQADELAEETNKLVAAFERRRSRTLERARPRVAVVGRVHAGVTVMMDGMAFTPADPLDGPLALTCRKTDGVTEVVCVRTGDGAAVVLPASPVAAA